MMWEVETLGCRIKPGNPKLLVKGERSRDDIIQHEYVDPTSAVNWRALLTVLHKFSSVLLDPVTPVHPFHSLTSPLPLTTLRPSVWHCYRVFPAGSSIERGGKNKITKKRTHGYLATAVASFSGGGFDR